MIISSIDIPTVRHALEVRDGCHGGDGEVESHFGLPDGAIARYEQILDDLGISVSQIRTNSIVLAYLKKNGATRIDAIQEYLGVRSRVLGATLQRLKAAGKITGERCRVDMRYMVYRISEK